MFLNLIPLFGLAASRVLLDERLSGRQWVGAVLIVVAVVAIARGHARAPTERERLTASAGASAGSDALQLHPAEGDGVADADGPPGLDGHSVEELGGTPESLSP
jgi:hypothetical protein